MGTNETQNIANYLKFGPIARRCGVPAALIGVGDQDHAGGIERNPLTKRFVAAALAQFDHVTARDAQSGDFLARHGAVGPKVGSDLLFRWRERARGAVKPTAVQPGRVAFAGELFRFRTIADGFANGGPLAACAEDADIDVLVMSDDDVQHAQRMQQVLTKAGASAAVVDLRDRDFAALVFLFASYSAVVTTRFHGLVIAALAEVPVLALDVADGKCARLLRSVDAARSLVVDGDARRCSPHRSSACGRARAAAGRDARRARAPNGRAREGAARAARPRGNKPSPNDSGARARNVRPLRGRHKTPIPLCWAASSAETNGFANLGDSLSAVMVAALSGRRVRHTSFDDRATKLVAVGSIGHAIKRGTAVVWGAGVSIRGGVLAENVPLTRYDVRAMRGRISAQHYRDFGIPVPDVYGDPVWLLPSIVHEPVEKKYELGVIPHIRDVADHHPDAPARADSLRYVVDAADARDVAVINTWHEPTWEGLLAKINLIRSCKRIASQSFHGLVIAEAYGIPSLNFRYLREQTTAPCASTCANAARPIRASGSSTKAGGGMDFHMYSQHRDDAYRLVGRDSCDRRFLGAVSLRRSAARRSVSAAARVRPAARPVPGIRQLEGAALLMVAALQEVSKDAPTPAPAPPTLKTANGKRPFVMIDGFNLGLEKGTGVATYARNLSFALRDLACDVGVFTADASTRATIRLLQEVLFFDSESSTSRWWARAQRRIDKVLAPTSNTAFEVPVTGTVIADPFLSRLPHYDSIWNVPGPLSEGGRAVRAVSLDQQGALKARARHLPLDVSVAATDQRRAEHLHAARSRAAAPAVHDARQEGEVPPARQMDLPQRRPHRHRVGKLETRHRRFARCGSGQGYEHLRGRSASPRRIAQARGDRAPRDRGYVRPQVQGLFPVLRLDRAEEEHRPHAARLSDERCDDAARDRRRAGLEVRARARFARGSRRADEAPPRPRRRQDREARIRAVRACS